MKKRVVVGMSGGVDSSVAALLLQQQGYDVVGVTLRVLPDVGGRHYNPETDESVRKARAVASRLGVEHHVALCSDAFTQTVLRNAHADFAKARTPNPCCYCNRHVKFGWMMDYALELGADFLATGHYVRTAPWNGARRLFKGKDGNKDQSYFLFAVPDERMAKVLTPLGDYTKAEVREIAARHGFANASASDSQDICFDIYGSEYTQFLQDQFGPMTHGGNFVTEEGKILRRHEGYHRYTVGQRKGLNVALGVPAFVRHVDFESGDIVVTPHKDTVCFKEAFLEKCVWHGNIDEKVGESFNCMGMVRYRQRPVNCEVFPLEQGCARVVFEEPLFAITPGQCAVFYGVENEADMVLGGGWIK
ncbi:MAG: tRNA 2-thiouridine(34) synthase MnmA [Fibrobacteraceae bacterium]|nr:tRNA 2-thiouridine(34) synthase MnmA [Fibrobacteraceae bacterium]